VNDVKLYPVVELMDICYGYRYGWLAGLLEVSDTVVLRPETKLGSAFRRRVSIKRYLAERCGIPVQVLDGLKIMLDHGIFVNSVDFARIFGVKKSTRSLVEIYGVLEVDYGLAYDVPSKLHVEIAVEIALSKLLNRPPNSRMLRALHPSMRVYVEDLANVLVAHVEGDGSLRTSLSTDELKQKLKRRMYRLVRQSMEENTPPELHDALYALSGKAVEETVENLEEQLEFKAESGSPFTLIPVVQGLFWEHVWECFEDILDLLVGYRELLVESGKKYAYIAIGTGGRVLSDRETKLVNRLMQAGVERARGLGVDVKFHLLGWSSPRMARKLRVELIYSSDSLSARRRAVEGRIYIVEGGRIKLVNVADIDPSTWTCPCPVCRDPKLRHLVLDPSGSRRNDARIVHNLWTIKRYVYRR